MTMSRIARIAVVLAVAAGMSACSSGSGEPTPPPDDADAVVVGTDSFLFEPADVQVPAGGAVVALQCEPSLPHDFVVEVAGGEQTVTECSGGQTVSGDVDLEAGTYVFFCSIPGHRAAGMEGTLTVG